jgi:hypothetical protein
MWLLFGERWLLTMNLSIFIPLTEDSLRQVCAFTTTFQKITCGYGIFPSKHIRQSPENVHIKDWGTSEYYEPGDSIKKYFK